MTNNDISKQPKQWPTPTSVEEAEDRALVLQTEIESISAQLEDKSKQENPDYATWARRAKKAKVAKLSEYRFIRLWLRRNRAPDAMTLTAIIRGATVIVNSLDKTATRDDLRKSIYELAKAVTPWVTDTNTQ